MQFTKPKSKKILMHPYYYLEVYDFFISRWKKARRQRCCLKKLWTVSKIMVEALKALAYLQEQSRQL